MTEHLNQLNVKMQGIGNTILSLQQTLFAFEKRLEVFIEDLGTGRLLHFERLKNFKDVITANNPTHDSNLQQLVGFTCILLQSFKARFAEFRERISLFKFITHPYECAVNDVDLSYIPGVCIKNFELEVADLMVSDVCVNKFKSLNENLETLERQQAELAINHK
uniref:uncharacterized protein LOC120346493 n=1 Tax=Styela clava TaxID=7725 RepID=UPI00193AAE21|nr:uncharacterized protein LOC120346493 [Styela clava]